MQRKRKLIFKFRKLAKASPACAILLTDLCMYTVQVRDVSKVTPKPIGAFGDQFGGKQKMFKNLL